MTARRFWIACCAASGLIGAVAIVYEAPAAVVIPLCFCYLVSLLGLIREVNR